MPGSADHTRDGATLHDPGKTLCKFGLAGPSAPRRGARKGWQATAIWPRPPCVSIAEKREMMAEYSCPNCGDAVPRRIETAAMITCPSCATTLLLTSGRVLDAGRGGEMHDVPLLFGLGDTVGLGRSRIDIEGHARFSYGRGFWDEFWGRDDQGRSVWVSVDEGDIVLQHPMPDRQFPSFPAGIRVGAIGSYMGQSLKVVETDTAECVALRGAFDERLLVGDKYVFVNAQAETGDFYSGEFSGSEQGWFVGQWYDPFEVRVERLA